MSFLVTTLACLIIRIFLIFFTFVLRFTDTFTKVRVTFVQVYKYLRNTEGNTY